jgi:hypothetical protein
MNGKIATGEIDTDDGKNAAAVALGRMGGKARAAGMTANKRKRSRRKPPCDHNTKPSFEGGLSDVN